MINEEKIFNILYAYKSIQLIKIEDFLVSEIDVDNLQETIDFIESDDVSKKMKFTEDLYEGDKYDGIYLEGNQYLLSNSNGEVTIIDMLSEENGVCIEDTRVKMNAENFIYVITNKKDVINWIRSYRQSNV